MFKPILTALTLASLAAPALADMQNFGDANRDFRWGRGGGFRGNEGSMRPGNFAPGQLQYGGNGCPDGTMRVVFAPDNLSFTILFDKFTANVNSSDNGQMGAMRCDATLPITIPAGQQMEITRIDYRGFVSIPQGGRGMLRSMFNFIEPFQQGPGWGRPGFGGRPGGPGFGGGWRNRDRINIQYNFDQPMTQNYEISTGTMNGGQGLQQTEVSPCGGDAQLHIVNTVRVMAPAGQQAQLTVDSIDGSSNAVYFVNWRQCQAVQPPPPPPPGPNCGPRGCFPPPPPGPGNCGMRGCFPPPPPMCGRFPCPPRR